MMRFEKDFLDDIRAGMWTSLKYLALLVFISLFGLMAWEVF